MATTIFDYAAIMPRAQAGYEAERGKIEPQGFTIFKMLASASGIAMACTAEAWSMTVALKALFVTLSDGTDLGQDMMSMRYSIVVALLLVEAFLHGGDPNSHPLRRWARQFRVLPVLAVLGGMSVFMYTASAQMIPCRAS